MPLCPQLCSGFGRFDLVFDLVLFLSKGTHLSSQAQIRDYKTPMNTHGDDFLLTLNQLLQSPAL